jgi:hypothetical protein
MLIVLDYISKSLKLKPLNGFRGLFTIRVYSQLGISGIGRDIFKLAFITHEGRLQNVFAFCSFRIKLLVNTVHCEFHFFH